MRGHEGVQIGFDIGRALSVGLINEHDIDPSQHQALEPELTRGEVGHAYAILASIGEEATARAPLWHLSRLTP